MELRWKPSNGVCTARFSQSYDDIAKCKTKIGKEEIAARSTHCEMSAKVSVKHCQLEMGSSNPIPVACGSDNENRFVELCAINSSHFRSIALHTRFQA